MGTWLAKVRVGSVGFKSHFQCGPPHFEYLSSPLCSTKYDEEGPFNYCLGLFVFCAIEPMVLKFSSSYAY
jgi:hypothetical protein